MHKREKNSNHFSRQMAVQVLCAGILLLVVFAPASAESIQKHYFGHQAVEDQNGVIAPWYKGQNGQFDFRVRVAAETLKRYPWYKGGGPVLPAQEFVFNGNWNIDSDGNITIPVEKDWNNGDLAQRGAYIISSTLEYYRYSGDPSGFKSIASTIDYILAHCQAGDGHGWPEILISVPTMGVAYHDCRLGPDENLKSGNGKIQLDIVAEFGLQLIHAYELTGNTEWLNTAKHWADLMVRNRRHEAGASPWGRYADNVGGPGMNGRQTGGVVMILRFLDELIRTGYLGENNSIVAARDEGRRYLSDVLLPAWYVDDTWGRHFWDWEDPVQTSFPTDWVAAYMMDHKDYFPNWKNDVRNTLSLYLNHTGANHASDGDNYSGAWVYPESSGCCARSLSYSPQELAWTFARYGVEANSEWGREIARRSEMIATYDGMENGQAMDNIDGGSFVDDRWFKIAQPMALDYVLKTMGWLPEVMGASRENHIMRSSAVVTRVVYDPGQISYSTFDAPPNTVDVLRLAFSPTAITANGHVLELRSDLAANGYTLKMLADGDAIVQIRHDGATAITVSGQDPQVTIPNRQLTFEGDWQKSSLAQVSDKAGATATYSFKGNQVRLMGSVGNRGGLANVYLDGIKQRAGIDCYSPILLDRQVLYYMNGLPNGPHTLKIVVRGEADPLAEGKDVGLIGVEYSEATGKNDFGQGGGPTEPQRFIFGYTSRNDYIDSQGHAWRPGTEFVARTAEIKPHAVAPDVVAKTWRTMRQAVFIQDTPDPELYRYGIHWPDFKVNVTVGPGTYHVRLKFAETQADAPGERAMTVYINDKKMIEGFDVLQTAGGADKAVDLVYNDIEPQNGVITVRIVGSKPGLGEATLQALEVAQGPASTAALSGLTKPR